MKKQSKHKVEIIPKEEIIANRSNAYEFINFDKQELSDITSTNIKLTIDVCKEIIKLQEEISYSKEEVNEMFETLKRNSVDNVLTINNVDLFISSWKKQFKNK